MNLEQWLKEQGYEIMHTGGGFFHYEKKFPKYGLASAIYTDSKEKWWELPETTKFCSYIGPYDVDEDDTSFIFDTHIEVDSIFLRLFQGTVELLDDRVEVIGEARNRGWTIGQGWNLLPVTCNCGHTLQYDDNDDANTCISEGEVQMVCEKCKITLRLFSHWRVTKVTPWGE